MTTAAEELRAAAAKLRKTGDLALMDVLTNRYWQSEFVPADNQSGRYAHGVRNGLGGPAGELAALFTPRTVVALAEWLDQAADAFEGIDCPDDEPAVALARLINPEETPDARS